MDTRSPGKRFIDSFAEEMGRWSARVCAASVTLIFGVVLALIVR